MSVDILAVFKRVQWTRTFQNQSTLPEGGANQNKMNGKHFYTYLKSFAI